MLWPPLDRIHDTIVEGVVDCAQSLSEFHKRRVIVDHRSVEGYLGHPVQDVTCFDSGFIVAVMLCHCGTPYVIVAVK